MKYRIVKNYNSRFTPSNFEMWILDYNFKLIKVKDENVKASAWTKIGNELRMYGKYVKKSTICDDMKNIYFE